MNRLAVLVPVGCALAIAAGGFVVAVQRTGTPQAPIAVEPIPTSTGALPVARTPPAPTPPARIEPPTTELDNPTPDLDGDGIPEEFTREPDTCGTGGCGWQMRLSTRPKVKNDEMLFKWGYFDVVPRKGQPSDFVATWWLGCCEVEITTYRFTRGKYRKAKSRLCDPRDGHRHSCFKSDLPLIPPELDDW